MLLSVIGSWIPSLWGDEAASQLSARRSIPSLFTMLGHVDAVHGTYYLFLHGWVQLFGYSAFAIRFPSAIAIGVCVGVVAWSCGRLASLRLGIITGIVCAILPRITYAGGEARSFSFDAAFAAVLFAIVVAIATRPGRSTRLWLAYGIVLAVATYFFIYTGLVAVAVGVFIGVTPQLRAHWRRWLLASAAALVTTAPLMFVAYAERNQIAYLGTANYASWDVILKQMWFGNTAFAWTGWTLIALAVVLRGLRLIRSRSDSGRPSPMLMAASWAVIPTALLLLGNLVFPLFTARYAAITAPAAAIIIGIAVDSLADLVAGAFRTAQRARVLRAVLVAAVLLVVGAIALPNWLSQRGPYAENQSDWTEIASAIRGGAHSGDAVIFDPTTHASRNTRLAYDTAAPGSFGPVDDLLLDVPASENSTWYASTYTVSQASALGRFAGVSRVWAVEYRTPAGLSGSHQPDDYGLASLRKLGYTEVSSKNLHASVVYLFTKTESTK